MKSWIAAAAVAAGVTAAMALDGAERQPVAQAGATAGQVIFVDPNTGEIRQPTAEEWSQLPSGAVSAKARTLPTQHVLPDGTILISGQALRQRSIATVDAQGKLKIDCDRPEDAQ